MNLDKIKYLALVAATAPAALFAQESSSSIDLSAAEDACDSIKTALTTLMTTKVIPAVLALLAVGISLWAIFFIVRQSKRGAAQATSSR